MASRLTRQTAEQNYTTGLSLFNEARYEQALAELQRAEHTFRILDARGSFLTRPLDNGISGLANALSLAGKCHEALGNIDAAISSFETSFINSSFERAVPFLRFQKDVHAHLAACYERKLDELARAGNGQLFSIDGPIDTAYRFPFSLAPAAITAARLFEIAPDRHPHYRDFYERMRERDRSMRDIHPDDARAVRNSAAVAWSILGALWIVYSIIAFRAVFAP